MADKTSFPMIPVNQWWALRRQFKQSLPGTVSGSYLATVLGIKEVSARTNILPSLIQFGFVDEDLKRLDRANRWRDDTQYPSVCAELVNEIYPEELRDAVPDPTENRAAAESWFALKTGGGQAAVRRMAAVYELLVAADLEKEKSSNKKSQTAEAKKSSTTTKKATTRRNAEQKKEAGATNSQETNTKQNDLGVHINLQIHVSSDATPDQIEKIFESMAKHIYRKG